MREIKGEKFSLLKKSFDLMCISLFSATEVRMVSITCKKKKNVKLKKHFLLLKMHKLLTLCTVLDTYIRTRCEVYEIIHI